MATSAPKLKGPDGKLREAFVFSTDLSARLFTGQTDADTVDMQVSIRGAAWSSDPDLIYFEGTEFTVPNPSAFPEGLTLLPGENEIKVRSVLTTGSVTPEGVITAHLSLDRDVQSAALPPSGLSVERYDRTVKVAVDGIVDEDIVGYHFYAATAPGGGTDGYFRVNPDIVLTGETVERVTELGTVEADANLALDDDGDIAADPLFVTVVGTQQTEAEVVLQTDFNQAIQVPESARQIRTTIKVEEVAQITRFSFTHDRQATLASGKNPAIPNGAFNAIPATDPLYYAATAVYLIDGVEYESELSPEVAAAPIVVSPTVGTLPTVGRQQIVRSTALSIFRSQPEVDIKPGSVIRDTFIDPFSTEAERIRFVIDFMHRAQSFATLLAIDDPGFTGSSVPVAQSPYKVGLRQAFFLRSNDAVQNLIDNTFDHLAIRRGVKRLIGSRARGEVVFFVDSRPATTIFIPIGTVVLGGGVRFVTTSAAQITASGAGVTFDPTTGRFSVRAFIQAEEPGLAGILAAGQISRAENGPARLQVTNTAATFGGKSLESNRNLAARADGTLSAVDSGTYRGIVEDVRAVPGVLQANVVDAGHGLMLRDLNPATGKHVGGKVDVWVRGENLATVTDSFAFSFALKKAVQFEPVGDISALKFRAVDPDLSAANPIIEMLDFPTWGYEFVNATTGKAFNLTDVTVLPPNGIQLSTSFNDPADINFGDVFMGSYRYRTSDKYVFPRQPVRVIDTLKGDPTRSSTVSPAVYELYEASDPLDMGRSAEAGDYLQVDQPETGSIPSGKPIPVTGEAHIVLDGIEYLNNLGVNPLTVEVYTADRAIQYKGPYDGGDDFTFIDENGLKPLGIRLTSGTAITEGDDLVLDYEHDENFVVTYKTNALTAIAQKALDLTRHTTADVLVKEAIKVAVDLSGTVVVRKGSKIPTVDGSIRSALARLFGSFELGQPVRQSDIINVIDAVQGVAYVVTPLTRMVKAVGSLVVREAVTADQESDYTKIAAWSGGNTADIYLLEDELNSATENGGGPRNSARGVFANKVPLAILDSAPDANGIPLKNTTNQAFIIGDDGMEIPGYSDDATLKSQFPLLNDDGVAAQRVLLTRNRVLLSLPPGNTPLDIKWAVTYVTSDDDGVKNIEPGPAEYLVLGGLDFSYDEDSDFQALVSGRVG